VPHPVSQIVDVAVRQLGREYRRSYSTELVNVWSYISTSPDFLVDWYLIKVQRQICTTASKEFTCLLKNYSSFMHAVTSQTHLQCVKPNTKVHSRVHSTPYLPIFAVQLTK
jgi:hypothetical protein